MANLTVIPSAESTAAGNEPVPDPPRASSPGSKLLLPILAAAAVIGLGLGVFVIAPMSGGGADAGSAAEKHGIGGGGTGEKAAPAIIEIENVVVNPAGAEGLHFIMCTVALEMRDKKAETWIRANEHIVRDVIIGTLSKQTLDSLGRPGIRNQIKAQVARDVGALIGGADKLTIYLPEFVVQ